MKFGVVRAARRLALALVIGGCVRIPDDIKTAFRPAEPGESSYFRPVDRPPPARGFLTESDLRQEPATDAAPEASDQDGGS
jgi:hypothetical protein